eukprot:JZ552491.1.p1 GENE.JZ552491.1~~JZ552491.1.p1  ORF type:complete len:160 (+),score=11.27 JZ552491.1:121-600(+)
MFFLMNMSWRIRVQPRFFGKSLNDTVIQRLYNEVEGTCTPKYGFIIAVDRVQKISEGKVEPETGMAVFNVDFQAIVLRPFKFEVIDAEVTRVDSTFVRAQHGPLAVLVDQNSIPEKLRDQIKPHDKIRVRILGVHESGEKTAEMLATCSMNEATLGILN